MKKNMKKHYTSPVLKRFGTVAKLTMKTGTQTDTDMTVSFTNTPV